MNDLVPPFSSREPLVPATLLWLARANSATIDLTSADVRRFIVWFRVVVLVFAGAVPRGFFAVMFYAFLVLCDVTTGRVLRSASTSSISSNLTGSG